MSFAMRQSNGPSKRSHRHFDQHYERLRQLIDALNGLVDGPGGHHRGRIARPALIANEPIPTPFGVGQVSVFSKVGMR
jgi:alkanesulfonate monooxygenase SsuD/methylene tetrahydromethanopterin reductase-like flavin-dependent oxidoreductase (luciferase family)